MTFLGTTASPTEAEKFDQRVSASTYCTTAAYDEGGYHYDYYDYYEKPHNEAIQVFAIPAGLFPSSGRFEFKHDDPSVDGNMVEHQC